MSSRPDALPSLTRRHFTKLLLGSGGLLLASGIDGPAIAHGQIVPPSNDPLAWQIESSRRLEKESLTDYESVYWSTQRGMQHYGVTLYPQLHRKLDKIVRSGATEAEKAELLEGWGNNRDLLPAAAAKKAAEVNIDGTATNDSVASVREILDRFAKTFPLLLAAAPNKFKTVPRGGGYYVDTQIEFTTPKNREMSIVALYHELIHALDFNWEKIKSFADRKNLMLYFAANAGGVVNIMDFWVNQSWETAAKIKFGSPLLSIYGDHVQADVESWELKFGNLAENAVPANKVGDFEYRYNRVVHAIAKKVYGISKNQSEGKTIPAADLAFKEHPHVKQLLTQAMEEIAHYLVGPVQSKYLGLPNAVNETDLPGHIITKTNLHVQQAKLRATSTLSSTSTPDQIRAALGLPAAPVPQHPYRETTYSAMEKAGAVVFKEDRLANNAVYRIYQLPPNPYQSGSFLMFESPDEAFSRFIFMHNRSTDQLDPSKWRVNVARSNFNQGNIVEVNIDGKPIYTFVDRGFGRVEVTSEPIPMANITGEIKPLYQDLPTAFTNFAAKRGADLEGFGNTSQSKVVYIRENNSDEVDFFPIPDGLEGRFDGSLLYTTRENKILLLKSTQGVLTIPSGRIYRSYFLIDQVTPKGGRELALSGYDLDFRLENPSQMAEIEAKVKAKTGRTRFRLTTVKKTDQNDPNREGMIGYSLVIEENAGRSDHTKRLYPVTVVNPNSRMSLTEF